MEEIGVVCGDKSRDICDQKTISLLFLCIGTDERQIFKSEHPHFLKEKEPIKELWKIMDNSFIRARNITHGRFALFSRQQKGESAKNF